MSDNTLHDDIQVLKEKVALLDGWRMGESERYDRLERDVAGTREEMRGFRTDVNDEFRKLRTDMNDGLVGLRTDMNDELRGLRTDMNDELRGLRTDMNERFAVMDNRLLHIDTKIDEQGQLLGARIDDSNRRINQILWLMLITIAGVATNLVVVLLK